ncbi:hypothetical protein EPI10_023402 [Gossypium australe]|uniref:Uncharacterized protein n=1 Tax=Gossypium australe TaxID=47621 RepID=A0A5B6VVX6_9ROSI|nr:hypothetical protein EPI10_023402 [Gossypium australe]
MLLPFDEFNNRETIRVESTGLDNAANIISALAAQKIMYSQKSCQGYRQSKKLSLLLSTGNFSNIDYRLA